MRPSFDEFIFTLSEPNTCRMYRSTGCMKSLQWRQTAHNHFLLKKEENKNEKIRSNEKNEANGNVYVLNMLDANSAFIVTFSLLSFNHHRVQYWISNCSTHQGLFIRFLVALHGITNFLFNQNHCTVCPFPNQSDLNNLIQFKITSKIS